MNDLDATSADDTVAAIRTEGGHAVAVAAPVGSAETADLLVSTAIEEFGRIDAMIANAGVLRDRVLWKMTDDDFDLVVDTHLRGAFTCGRQSRLNLTCGRFWALEGNRHDEAP